MYAPWLNRPFAIDCDTAVNQMFIQINCNQIYKRKEYDALREYKRTVPKLEKLKTYWADVLYKITWKCINSIELT